MRRPRRPVRYPGAVKRLGDFLLNSPPALQLAAAALVALVLFVIPPLHPYAWLIGLLLVVVCAGVLVQFQLQWVRDQRRIDDLNARLSKARGADALSGYALTTIDDDEPGPDTVAATRITELFPTDSGLVQHVRVESGFSPLAVDHLGPLRTFLDEFSTTSFENPRTHVAFMELYRAGKRFTEWVDTETRSQDGVIEIVPGDERDGGWRAFSAAREAGEASTDEFVRTRQAFQRVALENDVL